MRQFLMATAAAVALTGPVEAGIALSVLGQYQSGIYQESAAEIVTYDAASRRAFVINAASGEVDVLDLSDPANPVRAFGIDVSDLGADANSVATRNGIVAVAVEANVRTDPGFVALYDTDGNRLAVVEVGALPDALTFSPDGRWVLVANEGEPNDDYGIDPEGSVSILDLAAGAANVTQADVRTADFRAFDGREDELRAQGIRIFGPGATASQDFEPEWVEVAADNRTAYVSLQENNASAVVDIETASVTAIHPLGFKDWSAEGAWSGAGFDASDRDDAIELRHWPVRGIFQPDTIRLYETDGEVFVVTANEGDSRDYGGYSEEYRIGAGEVTLAADVFPDAATLQAPENLGRLRFTTSLGYRDDPDCVAQVTATGDPSACVFEELYVFGARSMAIFRVGDDGLELVFDTGSQMEETVAAAYPEHFNANHARNGTFDDRSDDKGPEPEGIAVGAVDGRTYAFVGLERIGGVMVYDITEPAATRFVQYVNNRDFSLPNEPDALTTTDLGAEGLHFVPAADSPDADGRPLLLVGNEVSGTTTVFAIDRVE